MFFLFFFCFFFVFFCFFFLFFFFKLFLFLTLFFSFSFFLFLKNQVDEDLGKEALPTACTCYLELSLPRYEKEEDLREKLSYAVKEGISSFGQY